MRVFRLTPSGRTGRRPVVDSPISAHATRSATLPPYGRPATWHGGAYVPAESLPFLSLRFTLADGAALELSAAEARAIAAYVADLDARAAESKARHDAADTARQHAAAAHAALADLDNLTSKESE